MKVGLVARAEDRGLGILTWEAYRHLHPDRTLVVRHPSTERIGFHAHLDRYPDATVAKLEHPGVLDEQLVRGWLDGLDVVYTAEVPYDWRLFVWARLAGVRTVCHVMPESWPDHRVAEPDAVWAPTSWMLGRLPGARVVPFPVAVDRFDARPRIGKAVVLHPGGHRAALDRNGTSVVLESARHLRGVRLVVTSQDPQMGHARVVSAGGTTVDIRVGNQRDYWRIFDEADLVVIPRRYGGLCLPAQEAMASGCAVLMSDTDPQRTDWPVALVAAQPDGTLPCPSGEIPMVHVRPGDLAAAVNELTDSDVASLSGRSLQWSRAHSWASMLPVWQRELERVCG